MPVQREQAEMYQDVPRKGNVDRNDKLVDMGALEGTTFPARGTWIEMEHGPELSQRYVDVPRKGNVDRNLEVYMATVNTNVTFPARGTWIEIRIVDTPLAAAGWTFPARGTWIEISGRRRRTCHPRDVPRKGNVDRNVANLDMRKIHYRRSPQGERG